MSYWPDFLTFSRHHLASRDVDPIYPVLRAIQDAEGLSLGDRVRQVVWYVAWYDLPSALTAWNETRGGALGYLTDELLAMRTGTERRGFRDIQAKRRHLHDIHAVAQRAGGWEAWVGPLRDSGDWRLAQGLLQDPWGNGRWAAYKTAELLQKTVGFYQLIPTDMGHAASSGPRKGLALLYPDAPEGNDPDTIAELDAMSADLYERMLKAGLPLADIGEAETCLCDFHSMVKGRYYVGHDIDGMLEGALSAPPLVREAVLRARREVLPREYLGEVGGWEGIQRPFLTEYRDRRTIIVR